MHLQQGSLLKDKKRQAKNAAHHTDGYANEKPEPVAQKTLTAQLAPRHEVNLQHQ